MKGPPQTRLVPHNKTQLTAERMTKSPTKTEENPAVTLKIQRRSSHPWIFQKMVEKPEKKPANGSVVEIFDKDGVWSGRGLYNGHSRISLRVLTIDSREPIDQAFFARRIGEAIALRRDVHKIDEKSNAYRLVHSEGDGLSGLVIDRFGDLIVVEFFSSGMFKFRNIIFEVLKSNFPGCNLYWFAEEHVQKQDSFDCHPPEPPAPSVIVENGLKFRVVPGTKHKTGYFVDQRDNRSYLTQFTQGKTVLDLCCNSGGFSVYAAAKGGAADVTAIDLDEEILEIAEENARMNGAKVRFVHSDIFNWLRVAKENNQQYDVVILDPAKQTRSRETTDLALRRYMDMNKLALGVTKPGGIFLTCSCTGLVNEYDFIDSVRRGAWSAGRKLQVFNVTGAGPDHPWLAHVPESRYLKAVWCRVQNP